MMTDNIFNSALERYNAFPAHVELPSIAGEGVDNRCLWRFSSYDDALACAREIGGAVCMVANKSCSSWCRVVGPVFSELHASDVYLFSNRCRAIDVSACTGLFELWDELGHDTTPIVLNSFKHYRQLNTSLQALMDIVSLDLLSEEIYIDRLTREVYLVPATAMSYYLNGYYFQIAVVPNDILDTRCIS